MSYYLTFRLHSPDREPPYSPEFVIQVDGRIEHTNPEALVKDFAGATMQLNKDNPVDLVQWRRGKPDTPTELLNSFMDVQVVNHEWNEINVEDFEHEYMVVSRPLFARAALALMLVSRFIENWNSGMSPEDRDTLQKFVQDVSENPQQELKLMGAIRSETGEVGQLFMKELYPDDDTEELR